MPGRRVGVMVGVGDWKGRYVSAGMGGWVGGGQGVRVGVDVGEAGAGSARVPWQAARSRARESSKEK